MKDKYDTPEQRLELYEKALKDWIDTDLILIRDIDGFCYYFKAYHGICVRRRGQFEKKLPELYEQRDKNREGLYSQYHYLPIATIRKGIEKRQRALIRAIDLTKQKIKEL